MLVVIKRIHNNEMLVYFIVYNIALLYASETLPQKPTVPKSKIKIVSYGSEKNLIEDSNFCNTLVL